MFSELIPAGGARQLILEEIFTNNMLATFLMVSGDIYNFKDIKSIKTISDYFLLFSMKGERVNWIGQFECGHSICIPKCGVQYISCIPSSFNYGDGTIEDYGNKDQVLTFNGICHGLYVHFLNRWFCLFFCFRCNVKDEMAIQHIICVC